MSLVLIVYLIGLIPKVLSTTKFVIILAGMAYLLLFILVPFWWDDHQKQVVNLCKKTVVIPIIAGLFYVLIPSEKTTYLMLAGYGVEKAIESPTVQSLAGDGVDVLKQLMARAKKELTEDAPKAEK